MQTMFERLSQLCDIDAVSGQEQPMVEFLVEHLTPLCDSVEVDTVGNVYATKRGAAVGPTVMFAAHTDEIGLVVKSVEPDGFLRFEKIGGVLDNVLAARMVRVKGQHGVIGMKAGHYQSADESARVKPYADMYIDIGAQSADEVAERGIEIGDAIAFVSPLVELAGARRLVAGKAVDDRLGCAVLLQLLESAAPPAGTLVCVFTSQEEVGLKGAGVAAYRLKPTLGIALDTMPCGDTPDMDEHTQLSTKLGRGPCIQVTAGANGRGFLIPRSVKTFVTGVAGEIDVPVQLVTFPGGNNDAATMAWAGEGTPACSVCLPRRYSHSPVEVADLQDADDAYRLLEGIVQRMDRLPSFDFIART